jgi:hypothetical protein
VEKIAQMRLQHMLPNSQNPSSLVSGMIGQVFGQKNKGQQPAAGAQPATDAQPAPSDNPLGDVLNQVLGGKKKNQQQQQQQPPPSPPQ